MLSIREVLAENEALRAIDENKAWESLDFLSFDDEMAKRARVQERSSKRS